MELLLLAFLGFILVTIVDRAWFRIDYKKTEKGLEFLEHYHYGIGLIIIAIVLQEFQTVAYALTGAGAAFIYHECKQDNLFAVKSNHFLLSSIIGIGLTAAAISIYFLYHVFNMFF